MEAFLIYLLKSSVILSLFYLVYFFFLRKDTFFTVNRHFLLAGILSSLLLPFLKFTTIKIIEQPVYQIIEYSSSSQIIENQSEPINWWLVAISIYGIITLLLLGRFGLQLLSLQRIFSKSQNKQNEEVSFIKTSKDVAPFSFFKYIIFNPALHDSKELEMIIKHEKIHAKQYHSLDILITNAFVIFQWINPFSWLYKKSLQQNLEFIADQEAIRDLPSKKEYQLTLIKVSSSNYSSITNNFYQSLIKKRIVMLNKKESNYQNLWKAAIILPLLSLFLWSFNTKTEIQYIVNEGQEQSNTPDEHQQKPISDDSKEVTFPIKEELPIKANEHSFPSKKEHSNTIEHQNIVKNTSISKFPIKTKKPAKEAATIKSKKVKTKKTTIEFIVSKSSSKEDLDRIKRIFKNEYAVEIVFSDIKRDNETQITGISVEMSSEKSNANFSIKNDTPIQAIVLSYNNKDGKISIGQSHGLLVKRKNHKDGFVIVERKPNDTDEMTFVTGGTNKSKIVIRESHGKNKKGNIFIHSDDSDTIFDFDNDSEKKPLFYIDGKEVSEKKAKKLKSKNIESVDVSKGKASIKKYGKKAKDGVIHITTKKKTKKGTGFNLKIDENNMHISTSDNNKIRPLTYVDGKKVSYAEFQKINQKNIASVNVYKAEKAIEKYGNIAENGVVEVILKK